MTTEMTTEIPEPQRPQKYQDVDRLENSDRLVAVFSQRSWDGSLTFSIHRRFHRVQNGEIVEATTQFIPESLRDSWLEFTRLAAEHLDRLKTRRRAGDLPFPEGGLPRTKDLRRAP